MCMYLAKQGFNICIVARNEDKMKEKLAEIKKEFDIETKYVVADFSKLFSIEDYKNTITSHL